MDPKNLLPQKVSDVEIAFPADVIHLMPTWEDIPEKHRTHESSAIRTLFFEGGRLTAVPKEGIDLKAALRHLKCIMGSFQPKHEHKMAALTYLVDLWFDKFEVEKVK